MPSLVTIFLVFALVLVFLPEVHAFGAGDIPDFSYLHGKAFRHGDIENILLELIKSAGHAGDGHGLLGMASSIFNSATGGKKFDKDDVKHVYFGNWLRDYSQAMDIGGLSKLSADTLLLIVSVLGFLTFGFATEEFEVTADRLGVYLPVEHIDNPKGYAEKEGDARRFHPRLRPPVDPRELQIDPRTGMKNYIATEGQRWDTSTAFIRRTFRACIDHGRRSRGREGADLWEAFRLLGQGLHTLEDFTAHSNWCEIALRKMGHHDVFCHVGDNVFVNSPSGRCPPIVTGTFGGADFLHSLMGEATDHISQSSVTDLAEKMKNVDTSSTNQLKDILRQFSSMGGKNDHNAQISQAQDFEAKSKAYRFDPDNVMPREVQHQLITLLKWHDNILREITEMMEMIPGLSDLIDKLSNALSAYVYTVIAPYVTPLLSEVTTVLSEESRELVNSAEQYEVFDNSNASDPTHSVLAKDHFSILLNEPAGKVAQVVVTNAVNLIVPAWSNDENPDRIIDQILEAFHHPYYASGRSQVQNAMLDAMGQWLGHLGNQSQQALQSLTKEGVRAGRNKREGSAGEDVSHGQAPIGRYRDGYIQESRSQEYGGRGSDNSYRERREYAGQEIGYDSRASYGKGEDSLYRVETQQLVHNSRRDPGYGETREPIYGGGYEVQERGYGAPVSMTGRTGHSYETRSEDTGYGERKDNSYGQVTERIYDGVSAVSGYSTQQFSREETSHRHSRRTELDSSQTEGVYEHTSGYGQERERHPYREEDVYSGDRTIHTTPSAPSYPFEGSGGYAKENTSYAPSYVSGYEEAEQSSGRQEYTSSIQTLDQSSGYESGRYSGYQEQASTYAPSYEPGGYEARGSEVYGRDEVYTQYDRREGRGRESPGEREHRSRERHHGGHREQSREHRHGHHGEHGRGHGNYDEETFGVERLSMKDDIEEREYRSEHRKEHGHHHEKRY